MRVRVLIRPKEGILDPQGKAVERALPAVGFGGVANVHVGRLVELDAASLDEAEQMCERLLANTLIEDYEVQAAERFERPDADRQIPDAGPDAPRSTPSSPA